MIVNGNIPLVFFLDSWTVNPVYRRNYSIYWILIQSVYCLLENFALALQDAATNWNCNCVFKKLFYLSVKPAASGWWGIGKASDFYDWPHCHTSCELLWSEFLVRSNTVWEAMMVDKALFKSMYDGFVRSTVCRKGKFITRVSIYSRKEKALSSSWRKQCNVVSMLLGQWLVTQEWCYTWALCWSLLLADMALSSSCSQVSFAEWKFMLLKPCIIPISATVAILFTSHLGNDRMTGERDWLSTEQVDRTRTCLGPILDITLPFDNGFMLCTFCFMIWWIRWHTAHDGQVR